MRRISWIKAALKDFQDFPHDVQVRMVLALEGISEGPFPDIAKPLKGFSDGVFELAVPYRGNAWRTVYAVKIDEDIGVLHAFQKKSARGIKTQKADIDLIKSRIRALRS
jgi:phage-related protein